MATGCGRQPPRTSYCDPPLLLLLLLLLLLASLLLPLCALPRLRLLRLLVPLLLLLASGCGCCKGCELMLLAA
jgi:hypothetical protein